MRRCAGYSLLDVMIAIGILAVAMTVLVGTQATAVHMTERANRMALAALMARSKMIDIEHELLMDGFSDMTETMDGDFRDEGIEDMEWEALVEVVEITPDAEEAFVGSVYGQLFGDGEEGGTLTGQGAVSQFLPMIVAQIPQFINDIGARVRKVTLTILWEDAGGEQRLTVQQFVVNLAPGGAEGAPVETIIDPTQVMQIGTEAPTQPIGRPRTIGGP